MTYRFARTDDFEAVNAIARQAHAVHVAWRPDLFQKVDYPFEPSVFQRRVQEKQLLLACESETILAYAAFDVRKTELPMLKVRTVLLLDNICVDEAHRKEGIATALIERLCALAKEWGCTDFELGCHPENTAGIALYESLGMRVKSIHYQIKL